MTERHPVSVRQAIPTELEAAVERVTADAAYFTCPEEGAELQCRRHPTHIASDLRTLLSALAASEARRGELEREVEELRGSSRSQPILASENANADGWIAWNGGRQPVADDVKVDLKFSDGDGAQRSRADSWEWARGDGSADPEITHYRLSDGALGRQDEVVQPIRDAPISSSKGEALPVAIEEPAGWLVRLKGGRGQWTYFPDEPLFDPGSWDREDYDVKAVFDRPASDKGEEASAWVSPEQFAAHVDAPYEAGHYLPVRKTSVGNFTLPLYARPSPGVSREEVARLVDHEGYWERIDGLDVALALDHITADQRADLERVRAEEVRGTGESLEKAEAIIALIGGVAS